ncbi:MAG: glycoside hydrolase domain-containing protein [Candidatus Bathyarchaeia archaeon]
MLVSWANEGEDKITQDELRASINPNSVINSVWNGSCVSLFGAHNEVVSFNLVLESPISTVAGISVELNSLTGPEGSAISARPASGNDVFNFVGRNIELFYVKYLKIEGLSVLAYDGYYYDERHVPERLRRPYNPETGEATGGWNDRPDHDKYYPDIAVPLELNSPFTIAAKTSQCIWGDIYIPKTVAAGNYTGKIIIKRDGQLYQEIPITVSVLNFALPDVSSAKTMLYLELENIGDRYLGEMYPEPGSETYQKLLNLADLHFQLAHRHKISLIDNPIPITQMSEAWVARLSGELFTTAKGYSGVGEGAGNNVYAIGTYGGWPWDGTGKSEMWRNTNAWVDWFDVQNFTTPTDYFLYLIDESEDYPQTEQWAQWINSNPGSGSKLKSFATIDLPAAVAQVPSLDIPCSSPGFGITQTWSNALATLRSKPNTAFYMYNGQRPASGTFATEDDGVGLRVLAWGQYKLGVDRWFYWNSDYYDNYQGYRGQTNVFKEAQTFGQRSETPDDVRGQNGNNYMNGDGVLLYPGTDTRFPEDSYDVAGPFASLRLKEWRRGIQDVDYLTLAAAVNQARVTQIVDRMVPKFAWEYGAEDPSDPTYLHTDISWSTNPDVWEEARRELAAIIEGTEYQPAPTYSPSTFAAPSTHPSSTPTIIPELVSGASFPLEYLAVPVVAAVVFVVATVLLKNRKRRS